MARAWDNLGKVQDSLNPARSTSQSSNMKHDLSLSLNCSYAGDFGGISEVGSNAGIDGAPWKVIEQDLHGLEPVDIPNFTTKKLSDSIFPFAKDACLYVSEGLPGHAVVALRCLFGPQAVALPALPQGRQWFKYT
ncbi:hypothetical protein LguiB_020966 [Lonicera macranthoides]